VHWLTIDTPDAIFVVPDNARHLLDPDGLCCACEPIVEREPDYRCNVVVHREDA
jgi:hypothetical protein